MSKTVHITPENNPLNLPKTEDKNAIKPGPAADNPPLFTTEKEPDDKDKAPEPPADTAKKV